MILQIDSPGRCRYLWQGLASLVVLQLLTSFSVGYAQETFVRQRETNSHYSEGDWVSYSVARFATSIAIGRQYIYFGTQHAGITRFHRYRESWDFPWTTSNGLTDNSVSVVAFDEDTDTIWCATRHAISYYQPSARKWRNLFKEDFGLSRDDEIESIGIDADGILLVSNAGRVYECSKFGGTILEARDINGNRNSRIRWFGRRAPAPKEFPHFFMSDGYLFNPDGIVEDAHFRRAKVVSAVEDDWGNMWIATRGFGAGKADTRSLRLDMLEFGLRNFSVDAMTFSPDVLWLGGSTISELSQGITAWNREREQWQFFEQKYVTELRSDQVNEITSDGNALWFSTAYGLSYYTNETAEWTTFTHFDGLADNVVHDVAVDDSSIWVATDNGISRIIRANLAHKDSAKIEPLNPDNLALVEVRDLELVENLLWAATSNGVYVYDIHTKVGGFSNEIEGPFSLSINSISRYENEIWFGSDNGIDVFDTDKREWLGVPAGRALQNTVVNKVVAAGEAVWAATNNGVRKYDRDSNSWRKFTIEDGLISNRIYSILLDGDFIWFGADNGVTRFYWNVPSRID